MTETELSGLVATLKERRLQLLDDLFLYRPDVPPVDRKKVLETYLGVCEVLRPLKYADSRLRQSETKPEAKHFYAVPA